MKRTAVILSALFIFSWTLVSAQNSASLEDLQDSLQQSMQGAEGAEQDMNKMLQDMQKNLDKQLGDVQAQTEALLKKQGLTLIALTPQETAALNKKIKAFSGAACQAPPTAVIGKLPKGETLKEAMAKGQASYEQMGAKILKEKQDDASYTNVVSMMGMKLYSSATEIKGGRFRSESCILK